MHGMISAQCRERLRVLGPTLFLCVFTVETIVLLTSCGGAGSTSKPPPPTATLPSITAQPASQAIPINRSGTFTVTASGTAPLTYQWYRNGVTVSNGNAASFSTPIITASDSGTNYSVTVSNSAGSVSSTVASLVTGPRAPAIGDYRYLMMEQLPSGFNFSGVGTFILGSDTGTFPGALGAPLKLGESVSQISAKLTVCTWPTNVFGIPQSYSYISTSYDQAQTAGKYAQTYSQFLQSLNDPNVLIYSMDIRPPCVNGVGVAYIQFAQPGSPPGAGGFDQRMEVIDPANLQSQVAADGAASRIVTAASFDDTSGKVVLLSYGWQGDTTTAYQAETFIAQPASVLADDEQLANQGYFISAFGGNDHDGYMIIGMRVQGDTTPRPYIAFNGDPINPQQSQGNQPTYPDPFLYTVTTWSLYNTTNAGMGPNFVEQ